MRWEHTKSREDLALALQRQLANMQRSFQAFDSGATEEAERIASGIYILCHDGPGSSKSKSLLGLLDLKGQLNIPDSTPSSDDPSIATSGPFRVEDGGIVRHTRVGDKALPNLPKLGFTKWWDGEVYNNLNGHALTRKNLIFFFRSQDGGAHVDGRLTHEPYYRYLTFRDHVSTNKNRTITINTNNDMVDAHLIPHLTVRQIAAELIYAVNQVSVAHHS